MTEFVGFPPSMQRLIRELSRLPSIGYKSAVRLAYYLLHNDHNLIESLSDAMQQVKTQVQLCERCYFFTETPVCSICADPAREKRLLCVVEKPLDVISIERTGEYHGYYQVLHGLWAPLRGFGPESMKLAGLITRMKLGQVEEIILALSATVEGDATALYITKFLSDYPIQVSRLAQGLPKGGELEYADDVTLSHAFMGRKVVNG